MNNQKIVFLGTPDFAVASLKALVDANFNIVAVVTAPDKPAGRGLRMATSAVKQFAEERNIPVLQPLKLKDEEFLKQLASYAADIQVVVAFRVLPQAVWAMPMFGTVNLHGSLLPQYRGAAPIHRVIMNGETKTGVTTFKLQQEIDTGNILLMEELSIGPDETAGELHDRMKETGAALLVRTIRGVLDGTLKERPQPDIGADELKAAPKIFTSDCEINWMDSSVKIHNQIRGLSPFPCAFTYFEGKILKIYRSRPLTEPHDQIPGVADIDGVRALRFSTSDGFIYVDELQPEGKKRMKTGDFLRGYQNRPKVDHR